MLFRSYLAIVGLVLLGAAAARLLGLLAFQIHTDEASWILWTDTMDPRKLETLWATFRADGRTPLYSWVVWALRQLPIEPLLAARLVSAACGVATAALIVVLGRSLLGSQYGLAGAVL